MSDSALKRFKDITRDGIPKHIDKVNNLLVDLLQEVPADEVRAFPCGGGFLSSSLLHILNLDSRLNYPLLFQKPVNCNVTLLFIRHVRTWKRGMLDYYWRMEQM